MAIFGLFKKNKKVEVKKETINNAESNKMESSTKSSETNKNTAESTKTVTKATDTKKATDTAQKAETAPTVAEKKTAATVTEKTPTVNPVPADEKKATVEEKITAPETTKAYTGKFEINKSKDGKKFFFNLYASNKVGIATSQMYSSAQGALNGVKSVIANADKAPIEDQSLKKYDALPYPKWEIYVDNGGKYRFRLNASNGSCVCHSQGYTTKTACKNGIDSIIRSSRNAEIEKTYTAKKDEN